MAKQASYIEQIVGRFWEYVASAFDGEDEFEESTRRASRPPVFRKETAIQNVLLHSELSATQRRDVLRAVRPWKRQRWFRSMKSSQALAQSVFGNLIALDRLNLISSVTSDCGDQPLRSTGDDCSVELEHSIEHIGEAPGRSTEVDVLIEADYRVAIECKFTESDVGRCSRPKLNPQEADYCCGDYSLQMSRDVRCSLTAIGVKYWQFIPAILDWDSELDMTPCPLNTTYQLVRNVLAACISRTGEFTPSRGVAVLLIDERNPAFQSGGKGRKAYDFVKQALRRPASLQLCTWQQLLEAIRTDSDLDELTDNLRLKYGI